jgi:hypothetical protein
MVEARGTQGEGKKACGAPVREQWQGYSLKAVGLEGRIILK